MRLVDHERKIALEKADWIERRTLVVLRTRAKKVEEALVRNSGYKTADVSGTVQHFKQEEFPFAKETDQPSPWVEDLKNQLEALYHAEWCVAQYALNRKRLPKTQNAKSLGYIPNPKNDNANV
jgi:hypothetical protein